LARGWLTSMLWSNLAQITSV